ncbi:MAG: AMP-binding protein, partial [Myxococcota bacterium]
MELRVELGEEVVDRVKSLARTVGVTTNTVVQAAWALLLARHTGTPDVVYGTTTSGRSIELQGVESVVGLLISTLPVRARINEQQPIGDWLREMHHQLWEMQQWSSVPLVEIQRLSQVEAGQSLFENLFVFQNYPARGGAMPDGLRVIPRAHRIGSTEYPLTVVVEPGTPMSVILYANDRCDPALVAKLPQQLEAIMIGLTEDARAPLSSVRLQSESAGVALMRRYNQTCRDYPESATVVDMFRAQVANRPHETAVVDRGRTFDFAWLGERVERMARTLRRQGVGPGHVVGICMSRSVDLVVAMFGVLESGAAYAPIDPDYPQARVDSILQRASARIVLAETATSSLVAGDDRIVLALDADHVVDMLNADDIDVPSARRTMPEDLAYIIFTSGSTGRPKGVMLHHRGLVNYFNWAKRAYRTDSGLRGAPVQSSIGFDLTVTSLLLPLVTGQSVWLVPDEDQVKALADMLMDGNGPFSLVKITPAHLDVLSLQIPPERAKECTHLFVIGGEVLRAETLAFWREHSPHTRFINEYGSTENTVGTVVYDVPSDAPSRGILPAGAAIDNSSQYVLDSLFQPLPEGVWGESFIGGVGVA